MAVRRAARKGRFHLDLLCRYSSLLRVGGDSSTDESGFEAGLRANLRGGITASLFETRTAQLVEGRTAGWAKGCLSGLLTGAEVGGMLDEGAFGSEPIMLIGNTKLTTFHLRARSARHVSAQALDGEHQVLAGLRILADAEQSS